MNRHALRVDQFRHEALLYASPDEFLSGTVPFIRAGVANNEPVLVVESPSKIEQLRSELGAQAEQVLFADMAELGANPAHIIPAWREFVNVHGARGKRLRGVGEPIWKGRSRDQLVECQRHESLLNVAFGHGQPWWLLCPYDTAQLDADVIDEARRSHEYVRLARSSSQPSDRFRGIDASGERFDVALHEPWGEVRAVGFDGSSLLEVRRAVAEFAIAEHLPSPRAIELVTAVNEVATNCILHGGGAGTVRMWREGNTTITEVSDRGCYDQPLADRTQPSSEETSAPRGLWLANQLCDLVQIRSFDDRNVVRLHVATDG